MMHFAILLLDIILHQADCFAPNNCNMRVRMHRRTDANHICRGTYG